MTPLRVQSYLRGSCDVLDSAGTTKVNDIRMAWLLRFASSSRHDRVVHHGRIGQVVGADGCREASS
jgi:hypothetical protein